MNMKRLVLLSLSLLVAGACASARRGPMAMTTLQPTTGSAARGTIHFQEMADGAVEVQVDLTGVPPGRHGFHVHEEGDCGAGGGSHFNPTSMPHAGPDAASHHAGDFGNVTAEANGEVHTRFTTRSITVHEGSVSVVGRTVILHADADDLRTQPSGNAGAPIACGPVSAMAGSMHH